MLLSSSTLPEKEKRQVLNALHRNGPAGRGYFLPQKH